MCPLTVSASFLNFAACSVVHMRVDTLVVFTVEGRGFRVQDADGII
jgi:hypothetical protein